MAGSVTVELARIGPAAFRAVAGSGGELVVDGAPEIGGEGRGMRPVELLLSSLASCACMDIVHILTRQREPLENLEVQARAERKDGTPAPFVAAHMRFVAHGGVDPHKLERAVALAVEKYCSVAESLSKEITITHEAVALPRA
jgi:putative redox protein